jgi:anti-anti-sigma regulatory factor
MGVGLLISVHNTLKKAGRQLSVIHVSKDIFDLFRTLRMHQHFSISGD